MKNFVSLFVILLVCIGCWIPVASAQDEVVPDSELKFLVADKLADLGVIGGNMLPFTAADMGDPSFTELIIGARDILMPQNPVKNLAGLEHATNLETLEIWYHDVSDLTPVANLTNLEVLVVTGNNIRSIAPLGNLTNLTWLSISLNPNLGDNISELETLTALETLAMSSIGVRDISPLEGLTNLEVLNASNNQITDISSLRNLVNLKQLLLSRNQIRDISPLQGTTALREVTLQGNQIRDLSSLEEWNEETRFISDFFGLLTTELRLWDGIFPITDKMQTNPLSYPSIYTYLPELIDRYQGRSLPARTLVRNRILRHRQTRENYFFSRVFYIDRVPTTLEVVSGDGQTVRPGEALPEPLVVMVLDENGDRFAGVPVTFELTAGEGTVEPAMAVGVIPTDAFEDAREGEAQTTFTASTVIGPQTVVATVTHEGPMYDYINIAVNDDIMTTLQATFTINVEPDAIAAPTIATVDPPLPTTLPVRWAAPSYAVQSYEIRYRVQDSDAWTVEVLEGTETLFTLPDLIPGTTYEWQVRAETEVGFTPWSPSGFATTGHVSLQRELAPAAVALARLVLNEIRNAPADRDDWVEVKNISGSELSLAGWELSIVAPAGDAANQDVDIVTFPDYTLPAGEVLLITNTDPGETALASGVNIATGARKKGATHRYLVASGLKLPATRYLLLLRSAVDKNGTSAALEDVAGNYFRETGDILVEGGTQVWPLQDTERPGDAPPLTEGEAWARVSTEKRGYVASAWSASGYHDGLGYRRNAEAETSLGTPGYDAPAITAATPTAQLSVSELMLTTGGSRGGPQWIELYNPSLTASVKLEGWRLEVEYLDAENARRNRYEGISFYPFTVLPNQTILLTTWHGENSGHFPESRVYHLGFRHGRAFNQRERRSDMLNPLGFSVKLLDAADALVDIIGNLDGVARTKDEPAWQVPPFETDDGIRVSLLRKYEDGAPLPGTEAASWRSAAQVKLVGTTYFGRETDLGTPGYRRGGALPVVLSHFHALRSEAGVVIRWTTESEVDMAGFNVLRSASRAGPFTIINSALIPGAGTSGEKHTYTFTDTASKPGVVSYYRLEEVSLGGVRLPLATARLRGHIGARGKLTTRWGELKAR